MRTRRVDNELIAMSGIIVSYVSTTLSGRKKKYISLPTWTETFPQESIASVSTR